MTCHCAYRNGLTVYIWHDISGVGEDLKRKSVNVLSVMLSPPPTPISLSLCYFVACCFVFFSWTLSLYCTLFYLFILLNSRHTAAVPTRTFAVISNQILQSLTLTQSCHSQTRLHLYSRVYTTELDGVKIRVQGSSTRTSQGRLLCVLFVTDPFPQWVLAAPHHPILTS